jgi:RNA polymerase sigma-70 factor, ECF subfamily
MPSHDSLSTSRSLLDRVKQREGEAWNRFAAIYTPLVYRWARQCGLQSNDAADVVQDVFTSVTCKIDGFRFDSPQASLRGWLWTITRNQVRLYFRRLKDRPLAVGGSTANYQLQQQAGEDPQESQILDQDLEPSGFDSHASLVHRTVAVIRQDFQPQTWQAFWQTVVENRSASEVAEQLGLTPGAVRQAKFRVLCRLQSELEGG